MKRFWRWTKPGRAIWEFYKKNLNQSPHMNMLTWSCSVTMAWDPLKKPMFSWPDRGPATPGHADSPLMPCCPRRGEPMADEEKTWWRCGEHPAPWNILQHDLLDVLGIPEKPRDPDPGPGRDSHETVFHLKMSSGVCTFTQMTFPRLSNVRRTKQKHCAGPFRVFNQKWSHPSRSGLYG